MAYSDSGYRKLLEDIFNRFPSVGKAGFSSGAYKPGLEHMVSFAGRLGNPERKYLTIHIAGTNGKGSVASMLASALSASGLKTGLYTSPHLLDWRERMKIIQRGGNPPEMVPKEYAWEFLTSNRDYFDEAGLSFFEITTGLAFKWFADSGVDVAVIEAGLGGRLDSTNILSPVLTVITGIGLDHCELLGDTLDKIAAEKAGIMSPGVPCIVGESNPETDPVFVEHSWMKCPLYFADRMKPSLWHRHKEILRGMDLHGEYQQVNLRTAMAAIDILSQMAAFHGLLDQKTVESALECTAAATQFRGRWEKLSDVPPVLCDIGHNPPALRWNFSQLSEMVNKGLYSSLIIVYGVMADKDLASVLPMMPKDATYVFTAADTPRALPADKILKAYLAAGGSSQRAYVSESVRDAIRMAMTLSHNMSQQTNRSASAAKPVPPLVFIGGSAYVVAEALPMFG